MALSLVEAVGADTPTINVDLDKDCSKCGEAGATLSGLCLKCAANSVRAKIEPRFYQNSTDQQFYQAFEAEEIGRKLVVTHHKRLYNARIEYVFLFKTPKSKDAEIWGRAKKISGLNAWLAAENRDNPLPDAFFVIEFSYDVWRELSEKEKTALVDHELSHCSIDDNEKLCLKGHDCEEFVSIVKRHGLWKSDVRRLLEAAKEAKENPLFTNQAA